MEYQLRTVKKIITGKRAVDGAGVRLVRVFGRDETAEFDPFLMLDAFDSDDPDDYVKGFPWHPHRGIETVTYLIRGDIEHGDSLGGSGSIRDGDCQWMTAGSGIIHQEMPKPSPRMLGAQLWLNLPGREKMTQPGYNGIVSDDVPVVREDGLTVRIIAGRYRDQPGAFCGRYVDAQYLDVEISAGTEWTLDTDPENTVFVYIFEGSGLFGAEETDIGAKRAVLFGPGEKLRIKAGEGGLRGVVLSGRPLREPIAWGGPIVMNTQEELREAFRALDEGTFVRDGAAGNFEIK